MTALLYHGWTARRLGSGYLRGLTLGALLVLAQPFHAAPLWAQEDTSAVGSDAPSQDMGGNMNMGGQPMGGPTGEDALGSMIDASDGEEGLIKAPLGGSGYPVPPSEVDPNFSLTQPDVGLFGNSFLADAPASASMRMTAPKIGPQGQSPVVVELFTSQGCSACPPADEMLGDLADRPDVLALSWHVDYWDYLGWADEFARPEFTLRQKQYANAAGERSIYTPQILVDGSDTLIDLRPAELMGIINTHLARPVALSVTAQNLDDNYQIELTPRAQLKRGVVILLVRYAPQRQVEIRAGENRGMTLGYRNIVLGVEQIAHWDGKAPLRLKVSSSGQAGQEYPADTRHAILAQQVGRKGASAGAILAAVKLD